MRFPNSPFLTIFDICSRERRTDRQTKVRIEALCMELKDSFLLLLGNIYLLLLEMEILIQVLVKPLVHLIHFVPDFKLSLSFLSSGDGASRSMFVSRSVGLSVTGKLLKKF